MHQGQTLLCPAIGVPDCEKALAFYAAAFGAERAEPWLTGPNGEVLHGEMRVGGALVMLAETGSGGAASPLSLGDTTVRLMLQVEDVDALWSAAIEAGAEALIELDDQFYGHRSGRLRDPFGHVWIVTQELERLSQAEMQRRLDAMMQGG